MKLNRRDPLVITGAFVLLLLLLMISVLGRMVLFLRFVSGLLVLSVLLFAGIAGLRLYLRNQR